MQENVVPEGYYFHPTNQDLLVSYLRRKHNGQALPCQMIDEVELYANYPWAVLGNGMNDPRWVIGVDQKMTRYVFNRVAKRGSRFVRTAGLGSWTGENAATQVLDGNGVCVGYKKNFRYQLNKAVDLMARWCMVEFSLTPNFGPQDFVISVIKIDSHKLTLSKEVKGHKKRKEPEHPHQPQQNPIQI